MKATVYIVVTFKFKKEGKKWVAYCEELGTSTFANTFDKAQERIEEAVLLHLNTLEDVGECANFFAEHNIKVFNYKPKKRDIKITGPFDMNTYAAPYIYPINKELLNT